MDARFERRHRSADVWSTAIRGAKTRTEAGSLGNLLLVGFLVVSLLRLNLGDFAAVNAVMAEYMHPPYPARSTVQVSALPRGAQVEIDAVLVLG